MTKSDEQLAKRAKALFDESVDALDAETLSRLNRGRQAALAAAGRRRPAWTWMVPATGVAAAAAVALVVMRGPTLDAIEAPVDDFEILLAEENIDMLEELEFYAWLDVAELEETGQVDGADNS